jgi:hypothetical protein
MNSLIRTRDNFGNLIILHHQKYYQVPDGYCPTRGYSTPVNYSKQFGLNQISVINISGYQKKNYKVNPMNLWRAPVELLSIFKSLI